MTLAIALSEVDASAMSESSNWLTQLRYVLARQAHDDEPNEHVSLSVMDLFDMVPDHEICEAYLNTAGEAGDPVTDALAAECERRNLEF